MRVRDERDAITQKFPSTNQDSSPISSASEIFRSDHVDLFFTRMSFFS